MLEVNRREIKYAVLLQEIPALQKQLEIFLEPDEHNGTGGYQVRSLYFDTLKDKDFEDKVDGYDIRQKIRLRIYNGSAENIKLELKEKNGNFQRKRSLILNREEAENMIKGNYGFLKQREEPLASHLYASLMTGIYRPKCLVEYDRLAYCMNHNDTRVTFDMNLRASESGFDLFGKNPGMYPVADRGMAILEVKYRNFLFSPIKSGLNLADRVQESNSKYCRARTITKKGRR